MLLCTFRTDRTSEYRIEHSEINKSYPSEITENINDGLYEIEMAYEQNRNGIVLQGLFNLEGRMLYKVCCKNDWWQCWRPLFDVEEILQILVPSSKNIFSPNLKTRRESRDHRNPNPWILELDNLVTLGIITCSHYEKMLNSISFIWKARFSVFPLC